MRVGKEVVETVVRRTGRFSGTGFQDWRHRLETCIGGCSERLSTVMRISGRTHRRKQQHPIQIPCDQLPSLLFLTEMTEGETVDIAQHVPSRIGGEVRRKLCTRFSGTTHGKRLHLIRNCVNPPKAKKLSEVMHRLEKWELRGRHVQSDYQGVLSMGLKVWDVGRDGSARIQRVFRRCPHDADICCPPSPTSMLPGARWEIKVSKMPGPGARWKIKSSKVLGRGARWNTLVPR